MIQGWFNIWKSIHVILHTNKLKNKRTKAIIVFYGIPECENKCASDSSACSWALFLLLGCLVRIQYDVFALSYYILFFICGCYLWEACSGIFVVVIGWSFVFVFCFSRQGFYVFFVDQAGLCWPILSQWETEREWSREGEMCPSFYKQQFLSIYVIL